MAQKGFTDQGCLRPLLTNFALESEKAIVPVQSWLYRAGKRFKSHCVRTELYAFELIILLSEQKPKWIGFKLSSINGILEIIGRMTAPFAAGGLPTIAGHLYINLLEC